METAISAGASGTRGMNNFKEQAEVIDAIGLEDEAKDA